MPKKFGGGRTAKKPNIPGRINRPTPKSKAVAPPPMMGNPLAPRQPFGKPKPYKAGGLVRGGGIATRGWGKGEVC